MQRQIERYLFITLVTCLAILTGCGEVGEPLRSAPGPDEDAQTTETIAEHLERPGVLRQVWGDVDGQDVHLYTLANSTGTICKVTNWGAILTELHVRDRLGNLADVVLGFGSLASYLGRDGQTNSNPGYMGCTIGRYCNRIRDGRFELESTTYQLQRNNDSSHLHGGTRGWDKQVWAGETLERADGPAVRFTLISPDGDENYPGEVRAEVVYILTEDDSLRIEFTATTDKSTPLSMTNHTYFNLAGEGSGSISDHELELKSTEHVVCDRQGIPTGKIAPVEGTPWDFTSPLPVGQRLDELTGDPGGYEINYVLRAEKISEPQLAGTLYDVASGRLLELLTTEVGLVFYSGNYLDGSLIGKSCQPYHKHSGLCLEPQFHPDSPNRPEFPSCILQPDEQYRQVTIYRFDLR